MSRGKYAARAKHQHALAVDEMCRALRKQLRNEQREHTITQRVAEQVPLLHEKIATLELQVELATCTELEELRTENAALREQRDQLLEGFASVQKTWDKIAEQYMSVFGRTTADMMDEFLQLTSGNPEAAVAWEIDSTALSKMSVEAARRLEKARRVRRERTR